MSETPAAWRDPAPLARLVVGGQWLLGGVSVVMAGLDLLRLVLLAGVDALTSVAAVPAPYGQVLLVGGATSIGFGVALIVVGLMSLVWIARTSRNAHAWAPDMTISPSWAVGWFFVPVAGLWKPFEGVSQTWRASVDPAQWKALRPPVLLRWWWAAFLVDNLVGQLSGRLEIAAHAAGLERAAALTSLVSDLTGVALAVLFAKVVGRLTALQAGRAAGGDGRPFDAARVFGP